MSDFQLILRKSPSRNEFRNRIGVDKFNALTEITIKKDNFVCKGCGFRPINETIARKILYLHLIEEDKVDYTKSKCVSLCKACLTTQHIDQAIKSGFVTLVNSTFSQAQLIEMQRINALHNSVRPENYRVLETNPLEFLEKMEGDNAGIKSLTRFNKTKVVFTSKFEWDDYI